MYATYERRWWTLTVLVLSLLLVIIGNTVLNVALPTLQRDLHASATELQWMVDAYALVFAGLLLTGGAIGDRFGRKGSLATGLAIFGLASLSATFATSAAQIVVARAVMGLGAALVMPATLSILTNVFPPHERAKAIGIWAGMAGSGAAIGPIAGGWLLDQFGWAAVFWINVGVVAVALVSGAFLVPTSRDPEKPRFDPIGAVLSILGLGALIYSIIEAPNHGWLDPITLGGFAAAAVLLVGFAAWELHRDPPMLDLRFFRNPLFSAASAAIGFTFMAMFGIFFLLTQYLQFVRGYSPFSAGLHSMPAALMMMVTAPVTPRLVQRIGPRRVVGGGMACIALALFLFMGLGAGTAYPYLAVCLVIMGIGMGSVGPPATASIMSTLPLGKAGVGSAVNDTTREIGGALGVAILGSLLASRYTSALHDAVAPLAPAVRSAANRGVGGALVVASQVGGRTGSSLATAARQAYLDGMHLALVVAAGVMIVGGIIVVRWFPAHAAPRPAPPLLPVEADVDGPELEPEPVP